MTSEITIYKTKLTPEKNAVLDSLSVYLSRCSKIVFSDCQFQKIGLDMAVKIVKPENYDHWELGFNYCSIVQNGRTFYFFIMKANWKGENTIELILSMDTANTYLSDLEFDERTHITRQHKDRFYDYYQTTTGYTKLTRKVDKVPEGISAAKITKEVETVFDDSLTASYRDSKWYLIYSTIDFAGDPTDTESIPVSCYCTSNIKIPLNVPASEKVVMFKLKDLEVGQWAAIDTNIAGQSSFTVKWGFRDDQSAEINSSGEYKAVAFQNLGNYWRLYLLKSGGKDEPTLDKVYTEPISISGDVRVDIFTRTDIPYYAIDTYADLQTLKGSEAYTTDTYTAEAALLPLDEAISRVDSRLMKVIELPYPPFDTSFYGTWLEVPDGWSFYLGKLRLDDITTSFKNKVTDFNFANDLRISVANTSLTTTEPHNIRFESKLYHSDFYTKTFQYDTFTKDMLYEYFKYQGPNWETTSDVNFIPTNTINSNFLFEVTDNYPFGTGLYNEITPTSRFLNVKRNNEVTLFNNEYVNYVKTGYNYDRKEIDTRFRYSLIQGGIGLVGGATSSLLSGNFGKATGISIGQGALATIVGALQSKISAESALQNKLYQLSQGASSTSGADDIDLLNYINGNKLQLITNEITDEVKNLVYDLLRLTGYECSEYGVPDVNTRCWYNFLQCEPQFTNWEDLNMPEDALNDLSARFKAGITFYHDNNSTWDLDQQYENFEEWLV